MDGPRCKGSTRQESRSIRTWTTWPSPSMERTTLRRTSITTRPLWKRSTGNKYEVIRKKAGKIVLTSTNEISNDGKTMTITTKGVNANGQQVHNVRVYEKQ